MRNILTIIGYVLFIAAWIVVTVSEISRGGNDIIICMSGAGIGSLVCITANMILSALEKK